MYAPRTHANTHTNRDKFSIKAAAERRARRKHVIHEKCLSTESICSRERNKRAMSMPHQRANTHSRTQTHHLPTGGAREGYFGYEIYLVTFHYYFKRSALVVALLLQLLLLLRFPGPFCSQRQLKLLILSVFTHSPRSRSAVSVKSQNNNRNNSTSAAAAAFSSRQRKP